MAEDSLATLIRAKYPDAYKDMSDAELEKSVLDKYPQYKPLAKTEPDKTETAAKPAEHESFLSSIWNKAATPLTDLPSRVADKVSNYIDPNRGTKGVRSIASAFVENLGHEISGLTSPIGLGLAAASGGASVAESSGLEGLAHGLRRVTQAASVPFVSQGIHDTITKPHLDEKLAGLAQVILGGMGLAEGGGLGKVAEEAKASPLETVHSNPLQDLPLQQSEPLPASSLPPDLVPVGKESEFNATRPTSTPKDSEQSLFDLAKAKQNMGQDLPVENTIPKETQSVDDIFNKPQAQKSLFSFGNDKKQVDTIFPSDKAEPEITAGRATNPDKPRYRLDNASGGLVPIDSKGEVIGQTIYPKSSLGDGNPPNEPPPTQETMGFGKDSQPKPDKSSLLQKIYDTPRGMMSVDLPYMTSAAFRQASPYVGTADWFKAWVPAAKSFGSKEAFDAINEEIQNRPLFKPGHNMPSQAEQAGLKLTDLGKYSKREEALKGELAEKIPIYGKYVASSNRAYTAFLNSMRANRFEDLVDNLQKDGIDTPVNRNQVANAINTLTGRGKLAIHPNSSRDIEGAAKVLSNVFFSPRKIASEIQMLNPATYIMTNPVARQELLAGALRRVSIWWGLAGAAKLAGATVSMDPTNPDFGKIKIGDTRIDPPGGLQQYLVLGTQLAKGGKTSSTTNKFKAFGEGFKPETIGSTIGKFGLGRFHPTAKYLADAALATKQNPFFAGDRAAQLAAPIYAQDLTQIAKENPKLVPMLLGIPLSGVGIGVQNYDKNSFKKPTFLPHQYDLRVPASR